MNELDKYIDRVKHLPPAPRILPELLDQLSRPNVDASRIEHLIRYDPALTASVLQLCNSASLATATPVTNLDEAILRLGFQQLYNLIAVASIARGLCRRPKGRQNAQNDLWAHSVATAVAAQEIARDLGEDDKLVFTAALLHDLGKVVLADALEDRYFRLCREVELSQTSLPIAEKAALGVQHAEIGARVLERWAFPSCLVAAVGFHHDPAATRSNERRAAQVYLANVVAYLLGKGCGQQVLTSQGQSDAIRILQLPDDCLPRYKAATEGQLATIHRYLQVGG
jgi:putative nucleotidyltransferase with HDIG domain